MNINKRKNAENLTAKEKDAFLDAVMILKLKGNPKSGRWYDTFVQWHQATLFSYLTTFAANKVVAKTRAGFISYAHSCPAFLPWHRALLYMFEKDLQEVSGDSTMTLPYWDSANGLGADSAVFQSDFLGGNGDKSKEWKVQDGRFGEVKGVWNLNVHTTTKYKGRTVDGDGKLRRAFGVIAKDHIPVPAPPKNGIVKLPTQAEVTATYEIEEYDAAQRVKGKKYFRPTIEGIHGIPHLWSGGWGIGSIADLSTSPNDPLFFLHHSNVDRWFAKWQANNPEVSYPIHEPIKGNVGQTNDYPMLPFGRPIRDFWDLSRLGYEYE